MDFAGRQDSVMAASDEMDPMAADDSLAEDALTGTKAPERTCIVTREVRDKERMIRFVASPDGAIVPDLKGDLPGRGLWVTAERGILDEAVKKNAFTKVTKGQARADAGLTDRVAALLERQLLDQLGLAKKSGHLVAGFDKVEAALRAGQVKFLLEASDGAADGRGKLARLAGPGVEIWAPLPSEALAPALGRQHAIHVAVKPGGMAERLSVTLRRLAGFTGPGIAQSGQKL
ncbi:RNA-binding protein [Dongia sp.]|uniref:RNA-binding protein n=1 Tax=Dongia sp. TaxID=1977262 RepID=UPI0035B4E84D